MGSHCTQSLLLPEFPGPHLSPFWMLPMCVDTLHPLARTEQGGGATTSSLPLLCFPSPCCPLLCLPDPLAGLCPS